MVLPFSALLSCASRYFEFFFKPLSNERPPLGAVLGNEPEDCFIFLNKQELVLSHKIT